MKCYRLLFFSFILNTIHAFPQEGPAGSWQLSLHRDDGKNIIFNADWHTEKGRPVWIIRNAAERIRVDNITEKGDSLIVEMPLFESVFRLKKEGDRLTGTWTKGGSLVTQVMPVTAIASGRRFPVPVEPKADVTGRWSVAFTGKNGPEPAIAELKQQGALLTGTFLNPTGDYRYQEGVLSGDSLFLSSFDGSHAYLFTAVVDGQNRLNHGWYYSGATFKQPWLAQKNDTAALNTDDVSMRVKPGFGNTLHFAFNDLQGRRVSITDARFRNKVVVVQLMGSWCPNCMDETAFLSDYYRKNRQRGVEIVSLAYEYSTDTARSLKTLRKMQQRFNVTYPMLLTGVTVNDSLRTEKTLPELTAIKFFPSSVILDKKGNIRKLDTGFNGPGTGAHYISYVKAFNDTINRLLAE